MEELLNHLVDGLPLPALLLIIAITLFTLSKGADLLVDEAVALSIQWGVSKMLIGATIVSLGTTLPEAAVSVLAAMTGRPGLALGNAVGSIICDTGLILGIATLMSPLPLTRSIVNRHGWIQLAAGFLLVLACIPYGSLPTIFTEGGHLPQAVGFVFLGLLVAYIWLSIRWAKSKEPTAALDAMGPKNDKSSTIMLFLKLIFAVTLVVLSSRILIPTVQEFATQLNIPQSIIAATLVAFGTSLPELVTAITAVRKGHGELAVGNIIGADILNVLFVAGAAASVTTAGLQAPAHFFRMLFPAMLGILLVFRIGVFVSGDKLKRPIGAILLGVYILVTVLSYVR